jgi:hypothetical protein
MIFVADAHRDDGKRFVVHADEKLTAFIELELPTPPRPDRRGVPDSARCTKPSVHPRALTSIDRSRERYYNHS